tara:strand:- start:2645 stop:3730 length:1086 start_codon:yes stop_codon:yes gene_type:complete
MKNITKVLLSIFASVIITSSANAGEVGVSGTAAFSYHIAGTDSSTGVNNAGKALGIANELSFSASGELDNGWSWAWNTELDSGAETTSGAGIDDSQVTITTDMGTIGIYTSEGSLSSAKFGWDVTAHGAASDNGMAGGMVHGANLSSYNSVQYHMPAGLLPFGITAKAGKTIGDASINSKNASGAVITQTITNGTASVDNAWTADSNNEYTVSATPIEGLTLTADMFEAGTTGANTRQSPDSGHWSAKYVAGAVSVGYGKGHVASAIGGTVAASTIEDYETTSMAVGFAVNENLSVSYSDEESTISYTDTTADADLTITSIQGSYTMGGLTIALAMDDIENTGYVVNADEKETMLTFTFAF